MQTKARGTAGGAYLFANAEAARRYTEKHTARLRQWGITQVDARVFEVNADLSAVILGKKPGAAAILKPTRPIPCDNRALDDDRLLLLP